MDAGDSSGEGRRLSDVRIRLSRRQLRHSEHLECRRKESRGETGVEEIARATRVTSMRCSMRLGARWWLTGLAAVFTALSTVERTSGVSAQDNGVTCHTESVRMGDGTLRATDG